MIKTIIALISIIALNGCNLMLPTVSDKSNAMLQDSTWQPINKQNSKEGNK